MIELFVKLTPWINTLKIVAAVILVLEALLVLEACLVLDAFFVLRAFLVLAAPRSDAIKHMSLLEALLLPLAV